MCDFFPQSLLIDILAMAQMEELPSLRNTNSPFGFYITLLQSFIGGVKSVNLFSVTINSNSRKITIALILSVTWKQKPKLNVDRFDQCQLRESVSAYIKPRMCCGLPNFSHAGTESLSWTLWSDHTFWEVHGIS